MVTFFLVHSVRNILSIESIDDLTICLRGLFVPNNGRQPIFVLRCSGSADSQISQERPQKSRRGVSLKNSKIGGCLVSNSHKCTSFVDPEGSWISSVRIVLCRNVKAPVESRERVSMLLSPENSLSTLSATYRKLSKKWTSASLEAVGAVAFPA